VTDYGMAVNPDHPELLEMLNDAIKRVKTDGNRMTGSPKSRFGEQLVDYRNYPGSGEASSFMCSLGS